MCEHGHSRQCLEAQALAMLGRDDAARDEALRLYADADSRSRAQIKRHRARPRETPWRR
jgi:hypothetical protein